MSTYAEDSFFSLTQMGQTGLALLSAVLCLFMLWVTRRVTRGRPWWLRLFTAIVLFVLFVWLSPQVYYTYYGFLFEDLPRQIVIGDLPGPERLARLLTFSWRSNLSAHSQGLLAWAMVAVALWTKRNAPVVGQ